MELYKRIIKIKELISDEVCMGTYGLVELELKEIDKEIESLKNHPSQPSEEEIEKEAEKKYPYGTVRNANEYIDLTAQDDYINEMNDKREGFVEGYKFAQQTSGANETKENTPRRIGKE